MVKFNCVEKGRKPSYALKNPLADDRMLFYLGELGVGECAGFLQHRVGNPDFADIVQQRPDANAFELLRRQRQCGAKIE